MKLLPDVLEKAKGNKLDDTYPVNIGYLYFADDELIRSPLSGSIVTLWRDIKESDGIDVKNFYSVNLIPETEKYFI